MYLSKENMQNQLFFFLLLAFMLQFYKSLIFNSHLESIFFPIYTSGQTYQGIFKQ